MYSILIQMEEVSELEKTITKFEEELRMDLKMDELSLKEKAMLAPVIKHKWVARTSQHKRALAKLQALKKQKIKSVSGASPVVLSKASLELQVNNSPEISQIQNKIEDLEQMIEYLEKVEKLTSSLTFDYKNVIELQKLETT
jgi:hypothetical protein